MWIISQSGKRSINLNVVCDLRVKSYSGETAVCAILPGGELAVLGDYSTDDRCAEVLEEIMDGHAIGISAYKMPKE